MRGRVGRKSGILCGLLATAAGAALVVASGATGWRRAGAPRAWAAGSVPVAFWAWRAEAPAQAEVESAARETGARALFLRAGQFDLEGGRVGRVRRVEGRLPRGVELHLVYNSTRALLTGLEQVGEADLAAAVVRAFAEDRARGARDGAAVAGLQLDIDAPTRLLARYGRVLRAVRAALAGDARLSATGLPTWMGSPELPQVLEAVDFWAPQFYGAEIPQELRRAVPVSSPGDVARDVARAGKLGKPFYAGLAAYGQAILYSPQGRLVELRGDLDPARVASDGRFELLERRPFDAAARPARPAARAHMGGGEPERASAWRHVFRAREEAVVDGLVVRAGEHLVFDSPSSELLRAALRAVREQAGEALLGVLVFRLPTAGDHTTLSLAQIAAALADRPAVPSTNLRFERAADPEGAPNHRLLAATNEGAAGSLLGEGALNITVGVAPGSVRGVAGLDGFDSFETLCAVGGAAPEDDGTTRAQPCSPRRANLLRLGARAWPPGARASARISFEDDPAATLTASVRVLSDHGRAWQERQNLTPRRDGEPTRGGGR